MTTWGGIRKILAVRRTGTPHWPKHRILLVVVALLLQLLTGWIAFCGHQHKTYNPEPVYNIAGPAPAYAPVPGGPQVPESKPDSTLPPTNDPVGRILDLTSWKLTIPEPSSKGTAASITPADSKPPWLIRARDGSLTFWAPASGATTPNSTHPRTELVSLHNFTVGTSPHLLQASVTVTQVPTDNQDIILGQIHGAADISSVPFVMLHYRAGTIQVVVKQQTKGSTSNKYALLTEIPLGIRFEFTIGDPGNGNLILGAAYGTNTRTVTIPIPPAFVGATVRFQAGAYQQSESVSTTIGGRVTFHSLIDGLPSS